MIAQIFVKDLRDVGMSVARVDTQDLTEISNYSGRFHLGVNERNQLKPPSKAGTSIDLQSECATNLYKMIKEIKMTNNAVKCSKESIWKISK